MYVLGYYKFKCFVYPTLLSCVSHSIDICTSAIKNIRNMHAVSTIQITDILHYKNNVMKFKSLFPSNSPTRRVTGDEKNTKKKYNKNNNSV